VCVSADGRCGEWGILGWEYYSLCVKVAESI
jgi:hypothetical protein